MNLTSSQILGMAISTLSVLSGATAQLTSLFGQTMAQVIVTICSLAGAVLGGWVAVLTGQGAQVKSVLAMPGVERVTMNAQANSTLAAIAIDPAQTKAAATSPEVRATLQDIVKSAT